MSQCKTCGGYVSNKSKSGDCRSCSNARMNADPEIMARRKAGMLRKAKTDPVYRQEMRDRLAKAREHRKPRTREHMLMIGAMGRAAKTEESHARAGRNSSATKLAWCPAHLREDYRALTGTKGYSTAEARQIIEEQHELEMARWRARTGLVVTGGSLPPIESVSQHIAPARRVLGRAAQVFSVSVDDIKGSSRQQMFVRPRCAIAHVLYAHGWSSPRIAAFLGKGDHTTCLNWLKRAEEMLADEAFDCAVEELEDAWAFQLPEALAA